MKNSKYRLITGGIVLMFLIYASCTSSGTKKEKQRNEIKVENNRGTYGYDVGFLQTHGLEVVELADRDGNARIVVAPQYQGRVMTSTSKGMAGLSYGWINHALIESGEVSEQFNPVGGEERFWLGPEGGPFSIYFEPGQEQVYENWKVPALIDTEPFQLVKQDSASVTFQKDASVINASGTEFNLGIERTVRLLKAGELRSFFEVEFPTDILEVVAYQSDNILTNKGQNIWSKENGLLSIWLLCMFTPSPSTTVFIPYRKDGEGPVVNDDYFGKVPSDRLIIDEGVVYFKIDGNHRSKIGIPPERAKELCGSYDSAAKVLTLVWGSLPSGANYYVNSKWGHQDHPYEGDVINAYNDGPVEDGSVMGPFYEIETSSPGAELKPEESLVHTQVVAHIRGTEADLSALVDELFDLELNAISTKFN